MTHIINRLQFQLNCSDELEAFNFRENFAINFYDQLTEAADEICSRHVGDDEWLKIDKLEIDLGRFSPSSFDVEFATIFKINFEKELSQKLNSISPAEKKSSQQTSNASLFKYFLLNGMFPWWADELSVDINAISNDVLTNQPAMVKHFFYNHQHKKNLWLRTIFQLTIEVKAKIILLIDELSSAKDAFILWLQMLNDLLQNENVETLNTIAFAVDDAVLKKAPAIFQANKNVAELLRIFQSNVNEVFVSNEAIIKKAIENNNNVFVEAANKISSDQSSLIDAYTRTNNENKAAVETSVNTYSDEENIASKFAVKHAGIILLAPFLKPFFTNLNLLIDGYWQTKEAQYKAAHLLKFLCTGTQQTPEYNLTLEKIICGFNIDEPIPLDVILSETEMNEAMLLLESVIEHWKALKNTSVNGLRETYLKRDGLLTKKDNGWLLQVERKTLDVLIDTIPWGFSTLNFSWSDERILVEW